MMINWQPIETAPKNAAGARSGPMVLVWDTYHGCAWTAKWTTDLDGDVIRTGWWTIAPRRQLLLLTSESITHWADLTIPAKGEEEE